MLDVLNPYKWLLYGGLIAALLLGLWRLDVSRQELGAAKERAIWVAKIEVQKQEAAKLLAEKIAEVDRANRALIEFKNDREVQDARNVKIVADLRTQLRNARLRDPYAAGCGSSSGSASSQSSTSTSNSTNNGTQTTGLLSQELTDFLLDQAASADEINLAYISCRSDSLNLRETYKIGN